MPIENDLVSPTTEAEWLALAQRLADDGFTDEAAAVRVFWLTIAETVAGGVPFAVAMGQVRRHAGKLGRAARELEERSYRCPD